MTAVFHIAVCRKPVEGTVSSNVVKYGVGGLNIDGCRIGTEVRFNAAANKPGGNSLNMSLVGMPQDVEGRIAKGRWPANIILVHDQTCKPAGIKKVKGCQGGDGTLRKTTKNMFNASKQVRMSSYTDESGMETVEAWDCTDGCPVKKLDDKSGASRFFKGIVT